MNNLYKIDYFPAENGVSRTVFVGAPSKPEAIRVGYPSDIDPTVVECTYICVINDILTSSHKVKNPFGDYPDLDTIDEEL